jgi:hypothetical protein
VSPEDKANDQLYKDYKAMLEKVKEEREEHGDVDVKILTTDVTEDASDDEDLADFLKDMVDESDEEGGGDGSGDDDGQ